MILTYANQSDINLLRFLLEKANTPCSIVNCSPKRYQPFVSFHYESATCRTHIRKRLELSAAISMQISLHSIYDVIKWRTRIDEME